MAKASEQQQPAGGVRLAAHPRARRHIAAAKGWGGLIGFGVVLLFSLRAGAGTFEAAWHALVAGVAFSMLGWAGAVAVWRQLAVAEVHAARRRAEEADARAREVAEKVVAEARHRGVIAS